MSVSVVVERMEAGGVPLEHITETGADGWTCERWRVKTTARHYIEVIPMAFNFRLHTVRTDGGPWAWSERYWCYEGRGPGTFLAAVLAAAAWDGADDSEPVGWLKSWDERYRYPEGDPRHLGRP